MEHLENFFYRNEFLGGESGEQIADYATHLPAKPQLTNIKTETIASKPSPLCRRRERERKERSAAHLRQMEMQRIARQNETPEAHAERLRINNERIKERRRNESLAVAKSERKERSAAHRRQIEMQRIARQNETPEARAERLRKNNERIKERRRNESPASRRARLERQREYDRMRRTGESSEASNGTSSKSKSTVKWRPAGKSGIKLAKHQFDEPITIDLKFCRFCLAMTNKTEAHDIPKEYFSVYRAYFGYEFGNNRNYPKKICTSCRNQFKEFTTFLETVNEAQSTVKTLVADELERVKEREQMLEVEIEADKLLSFQPDPISLGIPVKSEARKSFGDDEFPPLDDDDDNYDIPDVDVSIDVKGTFPLLPLEEKEIPIKVENSGNAQVFTTTPPVKRFPKRKRSTVHRSEGFSAPQKYRNLKGTRICDLCGFTYNTYGGIRLHIRQEHILKNLPTHQPFKCPECDLTFTSNYLRWRHKSKVHFDPNLYVCKTCGKQCENSEKYNKHVKREHGPKIICTICAEFVSEVDMAKHMNHLHTLLDCEYCGDKFEGRIILDKHIRHTHAKTPQVCPICKTVWDNMTRLKEHMKEFHQEKEMICLVEGCTFASRARGLLKTHLMHHKDIDESLKQQLVAEIDLFQATKAMMQRY